MISEICQETAPSNGDRDAAIDHALARSVLCRALRIGLAESEPQSVAELQSPQAREALARAAFVLQGEGSAPGPLAAAVAALAEVAPITWETLALGRARIFGHTLRGRVCPYEAEYGTAAPFAQAHEVADLMGFYRAFGFDLVPGRGERPDHIACQLEFVDLLSRKEAHALEAGDAEMLAVTRQALRSFLRRHLARFGCAFARSLERADGEGFHGRLGILLRAFLRAECARLGIETGPELLPLRPAEEDGVPMACGAGEDLVQIGRSPFESST